MNAVIFILIQCADAVCGHLNGFFASVSDVAGSLEAAGAVALAAAAIACSGIPAELPAAARRWHGSIDGQSGNIDSPCL
ncbi:MAG: hypothetical protein LBF85_06740 [Tannerella sp.]|jgi:hypothetical protein|nr:hypothetical protein [Tannerella sp.]